MPPPEKRIVTPTDLSNQHFTVGAAATGSVTVRVSAASGNQLTVRNDGLYVAEPPPPPAAPSAVPINPVTLLVRTNNVTVDQSGRDPSDRHKLLMEQGSTFGIVNLDFTPQSSSRVELFEIPASENLVAKYQVSFQPHNGGLIWIAAGSRIILGTNLQRGGRLLVNLTGIFGPP